MVKEDHTVTGEVRTAHMHHTQKYNFQVTDRNATDSVLNQIFLLVETDGNRLKLTARTKVRMSRIEYLLDLVDFLPSLL